MSPILEGCGCVLDVEGNASNGEISSDVQVQFAGNPAKNSHQNLLNGRIIGIRQEEVPVLVPHTEPSIFANQ